MFLSFWYHLDSLINFLSFLIREPFTYSIAIYSTILPLFAYQDHSDVTKHLFTLGNTSERNVSLFWTLSKGEGGGVISVHFQSPVLSVLLLHSRILGATVLKHRGHQQQTKNFVYIWSKALCLLLLSSMLQTCHQKAQNCDITHFLDKTAQNFAKARPKQSVPNSWS